MGEAVKLNNENSGGIFQRQIDNFKKNYFGMMSFYIIVQCCVGAVACLLMSYQGAGIFPIGVGVTLSMASNAMFIAQAEPKISLSVYYLSVLINAILLIAHIPH